MTNKTLNWIFYLTNSVTHYYSHEFVNFLSLRVYTITDCTSQRLENPFVSENVWWYISIKLFIQDICDSWGCSWTSLQNKTWNIPKSSHYVNKALAFETLGPWVEESSNFINRRKKSPKTFTQSNSCAKDCPLLFKGETLPHPWNSS